MHQDSPAMLWMACSKFESSVVKYVCRKEYVAMGMYQVAKAVSFLNNDCKMVGFHIIISRSSAYCSTSPWASHCWLQWLIWLQWLTNGLSTGLMLCKKHGGWICIMMSRPELSMQDICIAPTLWSQAQRSINIVSKLLLKSHLIGCTCCALCMEVLHFASKLSAESWMYFNHNSFGIKVSKLWNVGSYNPNGRGH